MLFIIVQGEVRIWRTVKEDDSSSSTEQELIRRSVDQFFGEFAMVTNDTPRSANVTAMTHVKLVTINKKKYQALNRKYNNVFEAIFAPHKRDTGAGEAVSQYFIFLF